MLGVSSSHIFSPNPLIAALASPWAASLAVILTCPISHLLNDFKTSKISPTICPNLHQFRSLDEIAATSCLESPSKMTSLNLRSLENSTAPRAPIALLNIGSWKESNVFLNAAETFHLWNMILSISNEMDNINLL